MKQKDQRLQGRIILKILVIVGLSGCSSDKLDDSLEKDVEKNRSSHFSLVNGLSVPVRLFAKSAAISRSVFSEQYYISDAIDSSVSDPVRYDWNSALSNIQLGLQHADDDSESVIGGLSLRDRGQYWVVAWNSETQLRLTVFPYASPPGFDNFGVRFVTSKASRIAIVDNEQEFETREGEVSPLFFTEDCASGVKIDGQVIDFCHKADFGKVHLITTNNTTVLVAQE